MEISKAVVIAGSSSADLPWFNVGSCPKPLVVVATKPILFHTLDALCAAGVIDVMLLTEPGSAMAYEAAVDYGGALGLAVELGHCAPRTDARGALGAAAAFVGDSPVAVVPADAFLKEPLREHVAELERDDLDALALKLVRLWTPEPMPALHGGYLLSARAVATMLGGLGDADPITHLRNRGCEVRVREVEGCRACHGSEMSLLDANRLALDSIATDVGDCVLDSCEIQGSVVIHPGAELRNTLVRGPAVIGARSQLVDSYIGPYSAIGADVRVEGTEIEHSIVMDAAQLLFVGSRLETSIIGRGARIVRSFDMPSAVRMTIGDGAQVALS